MKNKNVDIHHLNWNLLRTFYVIAEESSITNAARVLGVAQPSVSQSLQKLEEEVGCRLIIRDSRNFELTLTGERVRQECAELYQGVSRIRDLTQNSDDDTQGVLRLLIVSNLYSPLIDEAIRLLHQRSPAIIWKLEVMNSAEIVRQIAQEQASLGICLLSNGVMNLTCTHLFREEFGVFCGVEHPFFGIEQVTTRQLQQEPFVTFTCAEDALKLEPMTMLEGGVGLGKRISGSSPNLEEIRRMIICGLGIGVLPVAAVKHEIENELLWPIAVGEQQIGADVFLVSNPAVKLRPVEQKFADILVELIALDNCE